MAHVYIVHAPYCWWCPSSCSVLCSTQQSGLDLGQALSAQQQHRSAQITSVAVCFNNMVRVVLVCVVSGWDLVGVAQVWPLPRGHHMRVDVPHCQVSTLCKQPWGKSLRGRDITQQDLALEAGSWQDAPT
jgi:hypothetical protein